MNYGREDFLKPIPETERGDLILAYHAQLNSVDDEVRKNAARAWSRWEYVPDLVGKAFIPLNLLPCRMATSKLIVDPSYLAKVEKDDWAKYICHKGF